MSDKESKEQKDKSSLYKKEQYELEDELVEFDSDSEGYRRRVDWISIIQDKTNNVQTANLIGEVRKESTQAEKDARKALWTAGIGLVFTFVATFAGVIATYQQIESNDLTQRTLELSAQPTVFIRSPSQEFGFIRDVGTSTDFVLKNSSPTKIKDVFIYVTLMKTFYEANKEVLVIGPATQYVNEDGIFRNYGIDLELNTSYRGTNLAPLQEYGFSIFWPEDYASLNECGPVISQYNVYKDKFKYFLRIDVSYKRVIDDKIFSYTKFYSLAENNIIVDLEEKDEALNWIISDADDTPLAKYIIPFKSQNFINYITRDTPPYADLGASYISYDPSTDEVFVDPIRSREFSLCMRINLQPSELKE